MMAPAAPLIGQVEREININLNRLAWFQWGIQCNCHNGLIVALVFRAYSLAINTYGLHLKAIAFGVDGLVGAEP